MKKQIVYSNSLKRMIGFKIFPDINPENLNMGRKSHNQESGFLKSKKTDKQIEQMKRKLIENKKKEKSFENQIDELLRKMGEQGKVEITMNQLDKKNSKSHHYRIITEPAEGSGISKKGQLPKIEGGNRTSLNRDGDRVKTQNSFRPPRHYSLKKEKQAEEIVNVGRYLKHYRDGMSSLKNLKHREKKY